MIIHDFHVASIAILPAKAKPPLVVYANAVLAAPIPYVREGRLSYNTQELNAIVASLKRPSLAAWDTSPKFSLARISESSIFTGGPNGLSSIADGRQTQLREETFLDMTAQALDRHIEVTPGVAGGKPRIAGHRITVQNIVIWHERVGKSVDEISAEYDLTLADIYAALAYYFDHRNEIDQSIDESKAFVQALRKGAPSILEQKLEAHRGE
jgi:uncharacterized protein (DUF433 family)